LFLSTLSLLELLEHFKRSVVGGFVRETLDFVEGSLTNYPVAFRKQDYCMLADMRRTGHDVNPWLVTCLKDIAGSRSHDC
jgi:hypothetical protein